MFLSICIRFIQAKISRKGMVPWQCPQSIYEARNNGIHNSEWFLIEHKVFIYTHDDT